MAVVLLRLIQRILRILIRHLKSMARISLGQSDRLLILHHHLSRPQLSKQCQNRWFALMKMLLIQENGKRMLQFKILGKEIMKKYLRFKLLIVIMGRTLTFLKPRRITADSFILISFNRSLKTLKNLINKLAFHH